MPTDSAAPAPGLPPVPRHSVMITTRNRYADLAVTLAALHALTPPPDEILVTLDGCTDGSADLLATSFAAVRVFVNPTAQGSIPARDRMLRAAQGDLVLSLDDDSYPVAPDFFPRVAAFFARSPKLAVLWFPQRTDEFPATLTQADFGPDLVTGSFVSSGAVLRRSAYLALPGYATLFGHAYEEPDYAIQCLAAGWHVRFHTGLVIRHHYSAQNRNERRTHHQHSANEQLSILLRCPAPWWPLLCLRRAAGQFWYALRRGPAWAVREPAWWWRTLPRVAAAWRQRAPVTWQAYLHWLRLLRHPRETSSPNALVPPAVSDFPFMGRLGRGIAAIQRRLPRRLHTRAGRLPPLASPGPGPLCVVLCEPRTRWDALWAMWSWLRWIAPHARPALFVDGPVDPAWDAAARRSFPGVEVHSLPAWLAARPGELACLATLRRHYPFTNKLALITLLQRDADVFYCDADVVAFAEPHALRDAIARRTAAYVTDYDNPLADPWVIRRAAQLGLPCDPHLNSGLLFVPRATLDESALAALVRDWSPAALHRVTEQTLLGVLLPQGGAQPLPRDTYLVSNRGMYFWERDLPFDGLVARHYVGNVRHLLYSRAHPQLYRQARAASAA